MRNIALAGALLVGLVAACPASAQRNGFRSAAVTGVVKRISPASITVVGSEAIFSDSAPRRTVANATVTCSIGERHRNDMLLAHLAAGMHAHVTCFDTDGSGRWELVGATPGSGMRFGANGILTAIGFSMDTAVPHVEVTNGNQYPVTCDATPATVAGLVVGTRVRMSCSYADGWQMTTVKPLPGGVTTRTIRASVLDFEGGNLLLFGRHPQTSLTLAYTIAVPAELNGAVAALAYGDQVVAVEKPDGQRWLLASLRRA